MLLLRAGLSACLVLTSITGILLATPLDLDAVSGDLSYEFVIPVRQYMDHDIGTAHRMLVADFDRDGYDEAVEAVPTGILETDFNGGRRVNDWQFNVDVVYREQPPSTILGEARDVTGDGFPEVVFLVSGAPSSHDALMIYDVERAELVATYPLAHGADRNGDGRWDGRHTILGIVDLPRPAVVIMRAVGFDVFGRGVFAVDLETGELVWEYLIAGNPVPTDAKVLDLDGNGTREIVFGNSAPDNMGELRIEGESDVISRLHVLESDGTVRWTRILGGIFCGPQLDCADLDGDGAMEIVTTTRTHRTGGRDRLSIWRSGDGEMIAQTPISEAVMGLVARPSSDGAGGVICVGFKETGLQQYVLTEGSLGLGRSASSAGGISSLHRLDILPEPGDEFIAQTHVGDIFLLDQDLDPLARFDGYGSTVEGVSLLRADTAGEPMIVLEGSGMMLVEWRRRPFELSDLASAGRNVGLGALALAGVFVLARRRRRADANAFPVRDIHARLLRELSQASHDRLGVTRGLDRLVTQLDYLTTELGRTDELMTRTQATWAEFEESGLHRLQEILTLSEAGGLPAPTRKQAAEGLASAHRQLAVLFDKELTAGNVDRALPALRLDVAALDVALKRIRRQVESYFVSDLGRTLQRVLLLREDELARVDVSLDASLPEEGTCDVRIDPVDLRFIVDNLVGNALVAMTSSEARRLRVSATCGDDVVEIEFSDSGCGIEPELHGRIFSAGFSGRGTGGLGLARSREILETCSGELLLQDTEPGVGTTFLLRLRRSKARDGIERTSGE